MKGCRSWNEKRGVKRLVRKRKDGEWRKRQRGRRKNKRGRGAMSGMRWSVEMDKRGGKLRRKAHRDALPPPLYDPKLIHMDSLPPVVAVFDHLLGITKRLLHCLRLYPNELALCLF